MKNNRLEGCFKEFGPELKKKRQGKIPKNTHSSTEATKARKQSNGNQASTHFL